MMELLLNQSAKSQLRPFSLGKSSNGSKSERISFIDELVLFLLSVISLDIMTCLLVLLDISINTKQLNEQIEICKEIVKCYSY